MDFIQKYFIDPIIYHSGYNIVNTSVYAVIALISLYFIYNYFKKQELPNNFIIGVLVYVLFGSSSRAITDAIDNNSFSVSPVHSFISSLHIYDYGYLTITPGIYVVSFLFFFISYLVFSKIGKKELFYIPGLVVSLFQILLLLFTFSNFYYLFIILLLATIPFLLFYNRYKEYSLAIFAHALDGAATFTAIDIAKGYKEQHVLANIIANYFGSFFYFYLIKVIVAIIFLEIILKEKSDFDKRFFTLIVAIMGFAPGLRDLFRLLGGF